MQFTTLLGKYEEQSFFRNDRDIKIVEAKVVEYNLKLAFDRGYFKVLKKDQKVILKFIKLDLFADNESICHKALGPK